MPYYFVCPSCKQNNYGYKDAPSERSYYPDMECTRCGLAGISWVADVRFANGTNSPREKVAVGAFESDIAYLNPAAATGSTKMALQRLGSVATLVAPYSQGERGKAFTPNVKAVGEGQCAGQCLHWVRRVLQGGREGYLSPTKKGTVTRTDEELSRKYQKQHLVGAKAQLVIGKAKDTAANDKLAEFDRRANPLETSLREKLAEFDRRSRQLLNSYGIVRDGNSWTYSGTDEENRQKELILERVTEKRNELVAQINRISDKRNELIDKMNTQGVYAYAWEDMARELDQVLARLGAKKTFGNIVALQCVNRTKDSVFKDGTARSFAAAIVGSPDFQAGRAASLAVGLRIGIGESGGSISGHAIAVHYAAANELYLFDPNLGIYQTRSPAAMKTALETLMGPVWSAMGWSLDGSFGYAFFKAKAVPTPRSNERTVDYSTTSPTVTALKNQSIGTLPSVVGGGSTTGQKPPPKTPVIQTTQQFAPQSPPVVIGGGRTGGRGKLSADLLSKFGGS